MKSVLARASRAARAPGPVPRRLVGIALSVLLGALTWLWPSPAGLPAEGRHALAIVLFTVIWWVFDVMPSAFTTLLMLLLFLLTGLATPEQAFQFWSSPLLWLTLGAFWIAAAVTESGLARRVATLFLARGGTSFGGLLASIYLLELALSLLIPQPFPRTLLVMALIRSVIDRSDLTRDEAAGLGFAVFLASCATTFPLFTGDAMLNGATVALSGTSLSWLGWARWMLVPGLVACLLTGLLLYMTFRPRRPIRFDLEAARQERQGLGPLRPVERRTLLWVGLGILLWVTDAWHGVDPAWVALGVAIGLALPYVGEVLTTRHIVEAGNWPVILFLVGALAIGQVGEATGFSGWLATSLLPEHPPASPWAFALLIGLLTFALHLGIGSALATLSIVIPPLVAYAAGTGWPALVPALLVHTATELQFFLPYQNVAILLGAGETGGYGNRETLRFSLPLTLTTLLLLLVEVGWWRWSGLLP